MALCVHVNVLIYWFNRMDINNFKIKIKMNIPCIKLEIFMVKNCVFVICLFVSYQQYIYLSLISYSWHEIWFFLIQKTKLIIHYSTMKKNIIYLSIFICFSFLCIITKFLVIIFVIGINHLNMNERRKGVRFSTISIKHCLVL